MYRFILRYRERSGSCRFYFYLDADAVKCSTEIKHLISLIFARYDTGKTERYEVPPGRTEEVSLTSITEKIK
jgi:hypothetical protein